MLNKNYGFSVSINKSDILLKFFKNIKIVTQRLFM